MELSHKNLISNVQGLNQRWAVNTAVHVIARTPVVVTVVVDVLSGCSSVHNIVLLPSLPPTHHLFLPLTPPSLPPSYLPSLSLTTSPPLSHHQHELRPERVVMGFLPWAHIFGQTCELHVQFAVGSAFAIVDKRL